MNTADNLQQRSNVLNIVHPVIYRDVRAQEALCMCALPNFTLCSKPETRAFRLLELGHSDGRL